MRFTLLTIGILFTMFQTMAQPVKPLIYPVYSGADLGLNYSSSSSSFRVWSPNAEAIELLFYKDGDASPSFRTINMDRSKDGTWFSQVTEDLNGIYYCFRAKFKGKWNNPVPDPYAKAVGVNGKRAMVMDLKNSNPAGWQNDQINQIPLEPTDAIIYELHIRDASISPNSGIKNKGKYLGLAELGTKSPEGELTGLSHIKELGITHVHLLPFFDYNSVDERKGAPVQYNWGYDPLNYNAPEGSYSTDAYTPLTRIRELKQMIMAFHNQGIKVVFDAVYNHTGLTEHSYFNELVPGYYYRHKADGSLSDATACGNETASEKPMMRKFMIESLKYWVKEFHIDGFRFDLMGVHDLETMNLISKELHELNPGILLYGEGWTAGSSPLPDSQRALKKNVSDLHGIAVFSDDIRDGIKGSVFDIKDRGFATGKPGMEETVKFGIVAALPHPQIDYNQVNYSKKPYATEPSQVVTYAECHDNNTLWDKIELSCPDVDKGEREKMHKLALTIVLTSQGIPFLHAGTEFFRTKFGVENSYKSPDSINQINWSEKSIHKDLFNYIQQLINLRKAHPALRMHDAKLILTNIHFSENLPSNVIAYQIDANGTGDKWKGFYIALNGSEANQSIPLPDGTWKNALDNGKTYSKEIHLDTFSSLILYQE